MSKLLKCLLEGENSYNPIWFMRQAGRYLPEFREIRSKNLDFIKLCLNSNLSSEITLQPINRFELDAAIIFSDILIVPHALGQKVFFEKGEGPTLSKFSIGNLQNNKIKNYTSILDPVYKAINITRNKLDKNKEVIGFVGAPWTLIVYMLGLKNKDNKLNYSLLENKKKELINIIDKINDFLILHIGNQIKAGANIIQIFDSWAGLIPEKDLHDFCYDPNKKLVKFCKDKKIPVICFPKGINKKYVEFEKIVKPTCLSLDHDVDPEWISKNIKNTCFQGGMNPKALLKDEKKIFYEVDKYLNIFQDTPYIFNLGHGILPETNPEILTKVIKRVKNFK